ncbi:hypothetical protein OsJ_07543 [Oryza sativa Japonica Group]|uniref:Uncharacterized protein n=2 Tax=Oryza TaxID=4527 RepID=B9F141_ORYSJ|nr:hypothetical protein OsJ_07543 [Oryza sativa Japonica Group]
MTQLVGAAASPATVATSHGMWGHRMGLRPLPTRRSTLAASYDEERPKYHQIGGRQGYVSPPIGGRERETALTGARRELGGVDLAVWPSPSSCRCCGPWWRGMATTASYIDRPFSDVLILAVHRYEPSPPRIIRKEEEDMPLGLILSSLGRSMRRKRLSSLGILSSKRAPRDYYKGKNCKPTGFHTRKGGYVMVDEKLPRFVVPDLTDFKLKPYVSQCARDITASSASSTSAETSENKK